MNRQINTVSDILEVLRENPDALTELRSVIFPGDSGAPEEKVDELLQLVRRQEVAIARREEAEIRRDAAITRMGDAIAALVESVEGLRGDMVSLRGDVEGICGDMVGLGSDLGQLKGLREVG